MTEVRVLIVDDHPVFRLGVSALVDSAPGMRVVAEATDGESAVRLAAQHRPDVVLMDLQLPDFSGTEATARIRSGCPEVAVLLLTMFEDERSVVEAAAAGASGYLVKSAAAGELERAVLTVAGGGSVFGSGTSRHVMALLAAGRPVHPVRLPTLTERESDVLRLVSQGLTNEAVGRALGLSGKTVANYLTVVMAKLGVGHRAAAAAMARDAGLV